MISDGKKYHYLAVKSISALLRGITSNHNGDFYCLNCLHSYRTKGKLKKHEKVCNNHDYCYVKMPNDFEEILKYNPGEKSLKVPFMIFVNLECLLRKMFVEHTPSGYSWITCCSFNESKNKQSYYRGKDCMEMFCKDLRNQAMKIINYEKKKMIPLTDKETESYEKQKVCYICEKNFLFK